MTCPICRRPRATATGEALWDAHQTGAPLPEGWHSEDAEHLCWYGRHRSGCTPDENGDPVAVAQRLINEGADGALLLVAHAEMRLSAVLDAERGVKGLPGWVYDHVHNVWCDHVQNVGRVSAGSASVYAHCAQFFQIYERVGAVTKTQRYTCTDALDGMERAEEMIRGAIGR